MIDEYGEERDFTIVEEIEKYLAYRTSGGDIAIVCQKMEPDVKYGGWNDRWVTVDGTNYRSKMQPVDFMDCLGDFLNRKIRSYKYLSGSVERSLMKSIEGMEYIIRDSGVLAEARQHISRSVRSWKGKPMYRNNNYLNDYYFVDEVVQHVVEELKPLSMTCDVCEAFLPVYLAHRVTSLYSLVSDMHKRSIDVGAQHLLKKLWRAPNLNYMYSGEMYTLDFVCSDCFHGGEAAISRLVKKEMVEWYRNEKAKRRMKQLKSLMYKARGSLKKNDREALKLLEEEFKQLATSQT